MALVSLGDDGNVARHRLPTLHDLGGLEREAFFLADIYTPGDDEYTIIL